jgi:hypothetical protein
VVSVVADGAGAGIVGGDGPGEDALFLGQDPVMGQVREVRVEPDRAAVGCPNCAGGGGIEVDVGVDDLVGGVFKGPGPGGAVEAGLGWSAGSDGAEDVGAPPGGAVGGDGVEDVVDRWRGQIDGYLPGKLGREATRSPAQLGGLVEPAGTGLVDREPGLVGAGIECGVAFDGRSLSAGRVAALSFSERVEEHRAQVVHLVGALGELVEHLTGDLGDLGLAVDDRAPGDAVAVGELGAQHRLVEVAEGVLVVLEVVGVERVPPAVRGLDLAGDDGVGVELGVVLARGGLLEGGHSEPVGVGEGPGAVDAHPGGAAVALEVAEDGGDGGVVGVEHGLVAGEPPPHRHRFRCREGGVVAGHGLDEGAVVGEPIDKRRAERGPGLRVVARQERFEVGGDDGAGQSEVGGLAAGPVPRRLLGSFRVDVAGVAPVRAGVVAGGGRSRRGVDGPHPQHGTPPGRHPAGHPARPAGTCLSC